MQVPHVQVLIKSNNFAIWSCWINWINLNKKCLQMDKELDKVIPVFHPNLVDGGISLIVKHMWLQAIWNLFESWFFQALILTKILFVWMHGQVQLIGARDSRLMSYDFKGLNINWSSSKVLRYYIFHCSSDIKLVSKGILVTMQKCRVYLNNEMTFTNS